MKIAADIVGREARAEELAVSAKVIAAVQRRPGAFVTIRLTARGADGEPVSTSDYGMLYRGVTLEGGDRATEKVDDPPNHSPASSCTAPQHWLFQSPA